MKKQKNRVAWHPTRIKPINLWWQVWKQWHEPQVCILFFTDPSLSSDHTTGTPEAASIFNDLGGMAESLEGSEIIQAKDNYSGHNRKLFQGLLIPVLVTPHDPGSCPHKAAFSSHTSGMHCFHWELKLSLWLQSLLRVSASPHACGSYFTCHVWMFCWMMISCQVTLCLEICEKTDCNTQCHFFIFSPTSSLTINAPAQGFKLPFRASEKVVLFELYEKSFPLPFCLQELNSRQVLLALSVKCNITRGSHSKETPQPQQDSCREGDRTPHSPCGKNPHIPLLLPRLLWGSCYWQNLSSSNGSGKISCSLKWGEPILLGNMLSNLGCQWAQQNVGESQCLKSCPQVCTQSILEVDPKWRSESHPSI